MRVKMLLFATALLSPVRADGQAPAGLPPFVEVSGFAERRIAPDRATVMINITTKAPTATAAAAENGKIQTRVLDTLRSLGIGAGVSTGSYTVGPNYEPEANRSLRPSGYAAHASLRLRLSDINLIGKVMDAGLARGATGVDGVILESSGTESARRSAMADAAGNARADAEALARALGGTLGPIVSAITSGDPRRDTMMMRGVSGGAGGGYSMAAAPAQIVPSEIVVTATTLIRWQFLPNK